MKNWYIVQSHSSFENKVAGLIKEEADKAKISEKFEEIIVPTHDVTEVKKIKTLQQPLLKPLEHLVKFLYQ